jgi:acetyl esterase/lipase
MRKSAIASSLFLLIQLSVGASAFSVAAQDPDGRILSTKPRAPLPSYESLDEFGRGYFPRAVYDEARAQTGFDILEITYASDGQAVRGVLIRPKAPGAKKWPAIIFNRGGNGQLGSLMDNGLPCVGMNTSCLDVADLYQFAKAGFVVIASDYRYQGPTVKRDEWGGVEVDDVLNLVPALKSLDFVDPDRLYMLGLSRGGTMAYLAIKRGIPIKAAAVIGGVTDVKAWVDARPEMGIVNGNEPKNSSCRSAGRMFGGVFGAYAERFWPRCSPAGSSIGLSLSTAPQLCLHGLEPLGYWRSTASG